MRRLICSFVGLLSLAIAASAQGAWTNSYGEALSLAKSTGRPVLAYFTGSDWCSWCQKLDKEVLNTPAFLEWAWENVVLLELDYPKNHAQPPELKQQNSELGGKYKISGYPTVLVLTAKGDVMANQGYQSGGAVKWIGDLEQKVNVWMAAHPSKPINTGAYPNVPYKSKALFAKTDLRGKFWPYFEPDRWLTDGVPDVGDKTLLVELFETSSQASADMVAKLNGWAGKFEKDLVVVGITSDSSAKVMAFAKLHPILYNVALDRKGTLAKKFGVSGIPNVFVISSDGIVRWQGDPTHDIDPLTEEKLSAVITADKASRG
jgi:protein disulfide-isomerase